MISFRFSVLKILEEFYGYSVLGQKEKDLRWDIFGCTFFGQAIWSFQDVAPKKICEIPIII